jgi:hypothetical protein
MADNLFFSRDTRVIVSDGTVWWEIPVLDGFSFSQATNTSEITLAEMSSAASGNASRRGRRMFNDSYAPAEWSFSTYARPFKSVVDVATGWDGTSVQGHAVEEILWAALVGNGVFTKGGADANSSWAAGQGMGNTATTMTADFSASNVASLKELDIYFIMGQGTYDADTHTVYKLDGAVVNSAGIDFDLDGITTINWSGFAKLITEEASIPTVSINEGASDTGNFIRNRLTTLAVTHAETGNFAATYNLTLTGGSINFENNITFITPETLGVINQPFAAVTGTRNIGGSFTCYLGNHTAGSADLFEDLIESTTSITNDFNLVFTVGGATAPKIAITLPTCHLEVPTHSIEDVISLETTFHALPSTINGADEASIVYTGA